jgi:enoyl-CoA hydratase/carnithine racemase
MHHGKANAMDAALCDGIMKRLEQLRTSDAQAVVLTGQGNIFSTAV